MSYFAVCSFDLTHGATRDDYTNAYADLATLGLYHSLTDSDGKKRTLPSTTCAGSFNGQSATGVRDYLAGAVQRAFDARRFKYELFIGVGGEDWTWWHRVT